MNGMAAVPRWAIEPTPPMPQDINGQHEGRAADLEEGVRIRRFGSCRVEVAKETVMVVVPWTAPETDGRDARVYAAKYSHKTDALDLINPDGCDIFLYANVEALSTIVIQLP